MTYDFTLAAAQPLARLNPAMTFIYVSGAGTDSTEQGRSDVGAGEGQDRERPAPAALQGRYMFRPGFIQPLHGITSKTKLYRVIYAVVGPLYPVLNALAPKYVTTTEQVGRAMLKVAREGAPKKLLENPDINGLAQKRA